MSYGSVHHWRLHTTDENDVQQDRLFWHWEMATEAFQQQQRQPHIKRATVYAVQRSNREISTWDYAREDDDNAQA